jgi:hypothetical protein
LMVFRKGNESISWSDTTSVFYSSKRK